MANVSYLNYLGLVNIDLLLLFYLGCKINRSLGWTFISEFIVVDVDFIIYMPKSNIY